MSTWYFFIEGRCCGNDEIPEPFGFFVHAIISSSDIAEARRLVETQLELEGMEVYEYVSNGRFDEFFWEDVDRQTEMAELAVACKRKSGEPQFSEFQSWLIST